MGRDVIDWDATWVQALGGGVIAAGVFALMLLAVWAYFGDW